MQFREEKSGDFAVIPDSAEDFHRFLGIKTQRPRKYLFKYSRVTSYLLDSLREGYLWHSKPSEFNDPFDCKVVIDYQLTPKEVQQHVSFASQTDHQPTQGPRKPFRIVGEREYKFASRFAIDSSEVDPEDPESLNRLLNIAKLAERSSFLNKALGVCCFTEDSRSMLMWSHYAANHTGVCLRFQHRASEDLTEYCFPVQYRQSVWSCKCRPDDSISYARALIRSALIKSAVWKY